MSNIRCNVWLSEKSFVKNENKDLICSDCFSTSDERLLYENIKENINQNTNILHLDAKEALHKKLKTITTKYQSYSTNQNNNNTLLEDYSQLNDIETDSIDLILFSHVLDNIDDDKKLISILTRILKKNGKLVIKENVDFELESKIEEDYLNTPKLRRMFQGNSNAKRCYGQDLIKILEEKGFDVKISDNEKQKYNIQKSNELILDPLLICEMIQ